MTTAAPAPTMSQPPCDGTDRTDWVLAAPFRAHARAVLLETGLPWRALALCAGVPPRVLQSLLFGPARRQRRIRAGDALLLWQVDAAQVQALATTPVRRDAVQARVRLLRRLAGDDQTIAEWLRVPASQVPELATGRAWCSRLTLLLAATALSALGVDGFWSLQHLEGRGFAALPVGTEDADALPADDDTDEDAASNTGDDPAALGHWAA